MNAKLAEELLALPEVIEPEGTVEGVQAAVAPAGVVATSNEAKAAQRAPSAVTVTVPTAAEATLNVSEKDGKPVMSSMDIVAFINSTRAKHDPVLEHSDFMKKVREEIDNAGNFSGVYIGGNRQERPCYYLDEEASTLMAMSYSYDLQAAVLDA